MWRGARRLPVHILLDIDGTLLHPCRPRDCNDGDLRCCGADTRVSAAVVSSASVVAPFSCPASRVKEVQLRPFLVPFLTHLLVKRALDTSKTEVHVSLYTRQSAAYCDAVVAQVLLPALQRSAAGPSAVVTPQLFYRLYSGGQCVRVEECTRGPEAPQAASLSSITGQKAVCELCDWNKTISVSSCPLTTVLVDDKACNFRAEELTTGHAVLLPSFHPRSECFDCDDCLDVRTDCDSVLYDAMCGAGGGGWCSDAAAAAEGRGVDTDAESLLQLLTTFVHVCHEHCDTISELQRMNAFPSAYVEEAAVEHQVQLRARMAAHSAMLGALNLFDTSSRYQRVWNDFHAAREDQLRPLLLTQA